MKTPLYVKTLYCRLEPDNKVRMMGHVTNRSARETPPLRLYVSMHDARGDMVGRVAAALPALPALETHTFDVVYRLKQQCFFTVRFRLEKVPGEDYSDFGCAMHARGTPAGDSPEAY